jgi:hypothetical protein
VQGTWDHQERGQFSQSSPAITVQASQTVGCPRDSSNEEEHSSVSGACPQLEALGRFCDSCINPLPDELIRLPVMFPHLKRICLSLPECNDVRPQDVRQFLRLTGRRLVEFSILSAEEEDDGVGRNIFSDEIFRMLLEHYPNLETLRCTQPSFDASVDHISTGSMNDLIQACTSSVCCISPCRSMFARKCLNS